MIGIETESVEAVLKRHKDRVVAAETRIISAKRQIDQGVVSIDVVDEWMSAKTERIKAICDGLPQQRRLVIGSLRFNLPPNYLGRA